MLNFSSIVLLGNFNPAIFHPEWFDRFKVLPIQEIQWAEGEKAEQTEVKFRDTKLVISETPPLIVQPHLAHLEFPSLTILVQAEKFQCSTAKRDKFSLIRDVTIKTFSLLGHTSVRALGTNFEGHLKYESSADTILKRLFAREDETFKNALGSDYQIGGVLTLNEEGRKTTLRIEKSNLFDDGVFYNCNFHREIPTRQAEQAVALLGDCYDQDLEDVVRILKQLLGEPVATWKA